MQTLTKGYLKPETGDRGSTFFPALESNIQQVNDHDHNGSNSQKLTASSIDAISQTIIATGWVLVTANVYRQLVTMPGTLQYDTSTIQCVINNGTNIGAIFNPKIVKVSANTFYTYVNDNTLDVVIKYS